MRRALAAGLLMTGFALTVWLATARPSHHRDWRPEQAVLPRVELQLDDSLVLVRGVRTNVYRSPIDFDVVHEDRSYDLRKLERVWFVVAPFSAGWRGPAHVFLSFEFSDTTFVAVSVEARREIGKDYSIWKGMLRTYELIYVIGDERDLIALRAVHWDDPTYLYPIRASPEQARAVFTRMLERAARIHNAPEFYNTLTNNCTTNIVDQVNAISPGRIRYGWRLLLPGYTDDLAFALGLIDSELPLPHARERFRINEVARASLDSPDFSVRIRRGL
jgi:hypothetical protein